MSSTKKQSHPEQAVLEYLSEEQIPSGCSLLIAYSGGPDSSALLHVMYQLSAGLKWKLSCAYLDHGIRKPADTDQELEFIIRRCRFLGLPLVWKRLEYDSLQTEVRQTGRSLEDLAREKRYIFLFDQAEQLEADYIALGHTENDQLETQVIRFFQGAGVAGLKGIPAKNGKIIRPLMRCNRRTILRYLDTHDIDFQVDATNENQKFLRNAVRKQLMPILNELFPGYRKSLRTLAGKMSSINVFLDRESAECLRWQTCHHGYRIRTETFLAAAGPLRLRSVYRIIDQLVSEPVQIPYRFLVPLLNDDVIRERRVLLNAYGIRLSRAGNSLFLRRDVVGYCKKGYLIVVEKNRSYTMPKVGLRFFFFDEKAAGKKRFFRNLEQGPQIDLTIDHFSVRRPVVLRSLRSGDQIRLDGGNKRLTKLYAEWRVPQFERWRVPIVEDRQGILAVLGKPLGYRNRFRQAEAGECSDVDIVGIGLEEL